jgi:hypothetical protein
MDWTGQQLRFSAHALTGPGSHPASYTVRMSFLEVNQLERGINHQTPSSAEVKEREELYLQTPYAPYGMLRHVLPYYGSYRKHTKTRSPCPLLIPTYCSLSAFMHTRRTVTLFYHTTCVVHCLVQLQPAEWLPL